ncbi:hypothetical protein B0H17DRAFT_1129819 [Mycena rosella]|uniref:Uncharacterized protein n=1 Tax=Mycena rosella TaxID=1033263 RepID=A0AAD7DRV1_MYCRO|nr:hypothetical protein B0H17DRAFT_1129819 [Mycena rosella]
MARSRYGPTWNRAGYLALDGLHSSRWADVAELTYETKEPQGARNSGAACGGRTTDGSGTTKAHGMRARTRVGAGLAGSTAGRNDGGAACGGGGERREASGERAGPRAPEEDASRSLTSRAGAGGHGATCANKHVASRGGDPRRQGEFGI